MSLRNLGVERIDFLQLHVWHDRFLDEDGWQDALAGLKKSGKVRLVGVSVSEHDADSALRAASSGLFDAMQILYNIFDQRAAERLLPLCLKHGVGVLARVPFDEGGLTGTITPDSVFPEGDFRAGAFYRSWLRPQGVEHLVGGIIRREGAEVTFVLVGRGGAAGRAWALPARPS